MVWFFGVVGLVSLRGGQAQAGVRSQPYGMTQSGQRVERYVLTNRRGARVGLLTLGGIIDEISVPDRRGHLDNVVLALPNLAAYEATPNFSSIVGRYANRISHGGFVLDEVRYPLSKDPDAIVSHGGAHNFSSKIWHATPDRGPHPAGVTLRYVSPDGENGFPGELDVTATFTLMEDNALRIDYSATTTKPTVVNLTHHVYFNLSGGTHGNIDEQLIQIVAGRYAAIDRFQNANGEIRDVEGAMDLRQLTRIGARVSADDPQLALANGFNHNYVLEKPAGEPLPIAVRAVDPLSGRTLEIRTTEPGVQLYTANEFDGHLKGACHRRLRQGAGYALETQHYPDSPNQPAFPSTVLRPGTTFRSTTEFKFGTRPS